jgi:hypothetical protein
MGAASVDDRGRVFCRRMAREEKLRQQRSAAGRLGAAAKWQTDGGPHGEPYGEKHGERDGEGDGKTGDGVTGLSHGTARVNRDVPTNGGWQVNGEGDGEMMPPSHPSLSSHPLSSLSHEKNLVPDGTRDDATADVLAAINAWNAAAERVGRWPKARKLDDDRRQRIRARLKACGGIGPFLEVLGKAEASRFVREEMTAFALDWLLRPVNFRKVSEGNYDDRRAPAPAAGRVDVLHDVVERFRRAGEMGAG